MVIIRAGEPMSVCQAFCDSETLRNKRPLISRCWEENARLVGDETQRDAKTGFSPILRHFLLGDWI